MNDAEAKALLHRLVTLGGENEWIEFEENNSNIGVIGSRLSALSNMAALLDRPYGYLVYGVEDATLRLVGTSFDGEHAKKGNSDLSIHLAQNMEPLIGLDIKTFEEEGKQFTLFRIKAAQLYPTTYCGEAYCRIQQNTKKLKECPEVLVRLVNKLQRIANEDAIVRERANQAEVEELLSLPDYYKAMKLMLPTKKEMMYQAFVDRGFLRHNDDGTYAVTCLGAICFAAKLSRFESLAHKAIRIVRYNGNSRVEAASEIVFDEGYVLCFEKIIAFLCELSASKEIFVRGIRSQAMLFDELSLREYVGNMMVHGSLASGGAGPFIEVFSDRIEFSNDAELDIDPDRIVDMPPATENESLALFLHQIGIGDERGSGYDKIMYQCERYQRTSPLIVYKFKRLIVTAYPSMEKRSERLSDLLRDAYYHCVLRYVSNQTMTNSSLRERLGYGEEKKVAVSRLIKELTDQKKIKPVLQTASKKMMEYIPYWA